MKIRFAIPEDAGKLLEIYAPYVEQTAITFEYDVPSPAEFRQRIENISATFPYIVAINNNEIVGYAYASRYRERKAYDWAVEPSIYVDENYHGHHVGGELYHKLFDLLRLLNYHRAYACITMPNPRSVRFHEKMAFKKVGIMKEAGFKFNEWYDIEWMDLKLQDSDKVKKILKITDLSKKEIETILN